MSTLGFGCWAIGGAYWREGVPLGWGGGDDAEAVRALRLAVDLGVTLFDTADAYGCGHSERLLGRALAGLPEVRVVTKFGRTFDERRRRITGVSLAPGSIRSACEASLRRLRRERIDLYLLHIGSAGEEQAGAAAEVLEELLAAGKIGGYGWSTDRAAAAGGFAGRPGCVALEHRLNVLEPSPAMSSLCRAEGLLSIARGPLGMGLLTGKLDSGARFREDDVRSHELDLRDPQARAQLRRLESIGELLRSGGRTTAQGAIGWIWANSPDAVPIPGARTREQARENAGALAHGPLERGAFESIEALLGRVPGEGVSAGAEG